MAIWKKATFILILLLSLMLIVEALFHPRIQARQQALTIKTPQVTFYINPQQTKFTFFDPHPEELKAIIQKYSEESDATLGVYVKNFSTNQEVAYNPDEPFTAASLYKLAVMYTIFKKGKNGELDLDSPNIKTNLEAMITISSNEAALYLVNQYTSWDEITKDMHTIGLTSTYLNQSPLVTTPRDMGRLLELIAEGKAVNLEASVAMLKLLLNQRLNDRIPKLLPDDIQVAHKTGELYDVRHDAGIVLTPENDYILVIMSKDSANPEATKEVMAKISLEIYEFFQKQWQEKRS